MLTVVVEDFLNNKYERYTLVTVYLTLYKIDYEEEKFVLERKFL